MSDIHKQQTALIHAGRRPAEHKGAVNVPVYRSSTVLFETIEEYLECEREKRDPSYGTAGSQTSFALEQAISELEGGGYTVVLPSGLSAITTTLLALTKQGDHILITDSVYGPTRRFCKNVLSRFGVEVTYYDPLIGADIALLIKDNTVLIFTESPGSLTYEVQDIPAIVAAAKDKGILVAIDNSWATALNFRAYDFGVDIVIQACTKYLSGHSDVLLGSVSAKEEAVFDKIYAYFHESGNCASSDDCYLVARGLRTMGVRLKQHEDSALKVAQWLEAHDLVEKVLYPGLESFEGYELFKRDFKGATGLVSFVFKEKYDAKQLFDVINGMAHFGIGASWGGFESLILPFNPRVVRSATKWTATGSCVRIFVGLEDVDDLLTDLDTSFKKL